MTTNTTAAKIRAEALTHAIRSHRKGKALIRAGRQVDSLLRALIPLYVSRGAEIPVTCGATQRMWRLFGVKVQSTVIAKALREHVGYARRTRSGIEITPNGVKYVEASL